MLNRSFSPLTYLPCVTLLLNPVLLAKKVFTTQRTFRFLSAYAAVLLFAVCMVSNVRLMLSKQTPLAVGFNGHELYLRSCWNGHQGSSGGIFFCERFLGLLKFVWRQCPLDFVPVCCPLAFPIVHSLFRLVSESSLGTALNVRSPSSKD